MFVKETVKLCCNIMWKQTHDDDIFAVISITMMQRMSKITFYWQIEFSRTCLKLAHSKAQQAVEEKGKFCKYLQLLPFKQIE